MGTGLGSYCLPRGLAMGGLTAALLLFTLVSPGSVCGTAWPTHTACSSGDVEVRYQSCDPLQDFGFSIDQCSRQLKSNLNIRFGIILREDIRELFLEVALFSKGESILNFSYPICEEDLPKFSFCGRRKGEQIYYAGPIDNPSFEIPKACTFMPWIQACTGLTGPRSHTHPFQGEYQVLLQLHDRDQALVACANATVISF